MFRLPSLTRHALIFAGLTILAVILYYPILGNTFLSDDYDSLYRIIIEKRILLKEFFRPLIDVSFYLNYLISGMNSRSFYIINLIIHIVNAFLLYRFALKFTLFEEKRQFVFAYLSAVLFLVYPFHNEGVVWLTGRISSMATMFALLGMNLMMEEKIDLK